MRHFRRLGLLATIVVAGLMIAGLAPARAIGSVARPLPDSPYVVQPSNDTLNSVSCPKTTFCMAVGTGGYQGDSALSEWWNGSSWKPLHAAAPAQAVSYQLDGVSCVSKTWCVAVGQSEAASHKRATLAESWNGAKWKIMSTPSPSSVTNDLQGVSCPSSASCIAVGYSLSGSTESALAESWSGSKWTVSAPSNPTPQTDLFAVSCTSGPVRCMAVGEDWAPSVYYLTVTERWNGSKWTIIPSPTPKGYGGYLYAVSCPTGSSCTATGSWEDTVGNHSLSELWNGAKWKTLAGPNVANSYLQGVSCRTPSMCVTVGRFTQLVDTVVKTSTLAESWAGASWHRTPSPNAPSAPTSELLAISCATAKNCVAVGMHESSAQVKSTLTELWNGQTWKLADSPSP